MSPSPPHFTAVTELVCAVSASSQFLCTTFHTRTVPSPEADAIRTGGYRTCAGSQANAVTCFLWPRMGPPTADPLSGSHSRTSLSMPPLATYLPSGDHAMQRTQLAWPEQVCRGVSVS